MTPRTEANASPKCATITVVPQSGFGQLRTNGLDAIDNVHSLRACA